MDFKPFKQDIDELIDEFARDGSTSFADMKRVWLSKKFSFIFEARPSKKEASFMQSLYAHSIGYLLSTASLSHRLGGLYCLYCLYGTQPFKPPFKIYLSLGELRGLKSLVIDAKKENIKVASALVEKMLERNIFLFGFVDINEGSVAERVNELTDMQNARIQVAHRKLFADSRIEQFIHMDMGKELEVGALKKISTEYAVAKELAIEEASKIVDVKNIKHIAESKILIGDVVENTAEGWNAQKELFYQQTEVGKQTNKKRQQHEDRVNSDQQTELSLVPAGQPQQQGHNGNIDFQEFNNATEQQLDDENFSESLEQLLSQLDY